MIFTKEEKNFFRVRNRFFFFCDLVKVKSRIKYFGVKF